MQVVNPPKIKGELDLVSGLNAWEGDVLAPEKRFGERLSAGLVLAIVVAMLPKEIQDRSYEKGTFRDIHVTGDRDDQEDIGNYEKVTQDLTRVCNAKAQQIKPTPMEVGNVPVEGENWSLPELNLGKGGYGVG